MRKIDNSIWSWLKDERVSITGTILCPMLSIVIPLVSPLLQIRLNNHGIVTILYFSQFAFLIISLYFIMSNRSAILRQLKEKEQMLMRYFQKECHIRNEEDSPLAEHFTVVSDTVQQFYKCLIGIWVLWILFYGVESIGRLLPETASFTGIQLRYAFKCVIDFITSILLFILYLILNNVTVYRQKREEANPNELRYGGLFLIVCVCIIGALFIYSLSVEGQIAAFGYMTLVNLALGAFATFAFVILLGKLNSFYLQIPILLNLMVYFYAISQMFGPLTILAEGTNYIVNSNHAVEANVEQFMKIIGCDFQKGQTVMELIKTITENVSIAFLLGSLFGKLCLTMVLYWIVYKFRFIYFVITKSLSLTETPEKIKVFWRYIGEKGE